MIAENLKITIPNRNKAETLQLARNNRAKEEELPTSG